MREIEDGGKFEYLGVEGLRMEGEDVLEIFEDS